MLNSLKDCHKIVIGQRTQLRITTTQDTLPPVRTSELLKQFKALPRRERQKVFNSILELELEEAERPSLPSRTKSVKWPDVEARAKRIFGNQGGSQSGSAQPRRNYVEVCIWPHSRRQKMPGVIAVPQSLPIG
jgi:hypothetical protein